MDTGAPARGRRRFALVAHADVVLDCSDNYRTRQAINAACVRQRAAAGGGRCHPL